MASPSTTPTTVLITGGGGGLGKAIATAFLASGANVSVCDVSASRLAAAEREWAALAGPGPDGAAPRVLTTTADVTDEAAVEALVAATAARFGGRLDVLVNNAGVMDGFSPVGTCTREAWDRVMGVNLLGPFHMCRAAIAQFERQGAGEGEGEGVGVGGPRGGVIVNICSVAAKLGSVAGVAYTASKHVRRAIFLFRESVAQLSSFIFSRKEKNHPMATTRPASPDLCSGFLHKTYRISYLATVASTHLTNTFAIQNT